MAETKSKPILFSGAMVRAILEGRKTQTRRKIKKAEGPSLCVDYLDGAAELSWLYGDGPGHDVHERTLSIPCPHPVGSEMWVRETWQEFFDDEIPAERTRATPGRMGIPANPERLSFVAYRADGEIPGHKDYGRAVWRPSIFMPRWASRLTLTVTDVRVERLQDISEEDARAEGCEFPEFRTVLMRPDGGKDYHIPVSFRGAYANLWTSINGPGSWDANPYVWVYSFTVNQEAHHG